MREIANRWFQIALFTLLTALAVNAQTITTGDIAGTVDDESGAAVPGATITVTSTDSGEVRSVTSNGSGEYHLTLLRPGNYILKASTSGLKANEEKIAVQVGEAVTVNLVLRVQSTTEVIEVNETATLVHAENADATTTFTPQQVLELPAPGGDLTTVAFTVPGIALSTGMGYGNFSSHGLPGTSNLYTMNGNDYKIRI